MEQLAQSLRALLPNVSEDTPLGQTLAEIGRRKQDYAERIAAGEKLPPWWQYQQAWREASLAECVDPKLAPDGGAWCVRCSGIRWLMPRNPDGSALAVDDPRFGKLVSCPDCSKRPRTEAELDAITAACGLDPAERQLTFASFAPVDEYQAGLIMHLQRWAAKPDGWICLYGEPGSGKTHLAAATANAIIGSNRRCFWRYGPTLAKEAMLRSQDGTLVDLEAILKSDIPVFVDDVGAIRGTEFRIGDFLEPLANHRYVNKLPTFWTCIGGPVALKDPYIGISESIGRRMEDPTRCLLLRNRAPQWRAPEYEL